jgi:ubiquinone/menaquinone biosynthesis C-methylase UbiE
VDSSAEMLEQARVRLAGIQSAEFRTGELEQLPLGSGELDAALVSLVLHHSPEPRRAIEEASRVLRKGGRLLLVDLLPHDRVEYREHMGHVWLGFSAEQVTEWLKGAGLSRVKVVELPRDPGAKGPALFVATGVK